MVGALLYFVYIYCIAVLGCFLIYSIVRGTARSKEEMKMTEQSVYVKSRKSVEYFQTKVGRFNIYSNWSRKTSCILLFRFRGLLLLLLLLTSSPSASSSA